MPNNADRVVQRRRQRHVHLPSDPQRRGDAQRVSFKLLDPVQNGGKAVLMLEGKRLASQPRESTVSVPQVKGRFVFFLHNSVARVDGQPANYRVAVYGVRYEDGMQAEIPVCDGIEIHHWWTAQWSEKTGLGARFPEHPEISEFLYTQSHRTGNTVKGITVYGLTSDEPPWYPSTPAWRRWRDLGNGGAEVSSEFTITETIGASAMLYSVLYALELGRP